MWIIGITFAAGVFLTLLIRALTGRWFTPNTWYWVGWTIGLAFAKLAASLLLLPELTPLAENLILTSHVWAAVGFLVASVFGKLANGKRPRLSSVIDILLPPNLFRRITVFYTILGAAHLLYRLAIVGSFSSSILLDIRESYLDDPYGFTRLATIAFTPLLPIFALYGADDKTSDRLDLKRMLALYFAAALHGFAMGGRIWLAYPIAVYLFSYLLLISDTDKTRVIIRSLFRKLAPLIVAGLLLFIVIDVARRTEFVRDATPLSERVAATPQTSGIMAPVTYAGVALASIDLTSQSANSWAPLYGQMLFPWFAQQLGRLGLIEYFEQNWVIDRDLIRQIDHRVASTQCTALCLAVGDFGFDGAPYAIGVLMGICQFAALLFVGKGMFRQILATTCVMAAAMTVQDTWFGIPTNAVGIPAAALIVLYIRWRYQETSFRGRPRYRRGYHRVANQRTHFRVP